MDWTVIIQYLFGGAAISALSSVITLKATRKQAEANARGSELDNVQEAVKIWRELAESFKTDLDQARKDNADITCQIESLRKEVAKLSNVLNRVLKLLDKITPDNIETTVNEIRNEIHDRTA
jgi:chromosome segregation ATPase